MDINKEVHNVVIFIGIQACGKTTFYNQFYHEIFHDYTHINLDTLHTRNKERIAIMECISNKKSFVVDNTNPTKEEPCKIYQDSPREWI